MNKQETMNLLSRAKREGILAELQNDQLVFKIIKGKKVTLEIFEALKIAKEDIFTFLKIETTLVKTLSNGNYQIKPYDRTKIKKIPLSYSQKSAWINEKLRGNKINLSKKIIRFNGIFDIQILESVVKEIVKRHEILRTLIWLDADGTPYQQIESIENWTIEVVNHEELSQEKDENYYLNKSINRDFDLSKNFPFQATFIEVAKDKLTLLLMLHHICTDQASEDIFYREFSELYMSKILKRKAFLSNNRIQYADYSIWQKDYLKKGIFKEKMNFWKNKLSDVSLVKFPYDKGINNIEKNRATDITLIISNEKFKQIREFSILHGVTEFMFFLSILNVLMYKYTGQGDICIGVPLENRTQEEVRNLIGFFINAGVIRTEVCKDESFEDVLVAVKNSVLNVFSDQDVPFQEILNELKIARVGNSNPIYSTVFNYLNVSEVSNGLDSDGLGIVEEYVKETKGAEFDTILTVVKRLETYELTLRYNSCFYTHDSALRICKNFEHLISSVLEKSTQKIKHLSLCSSEDVFKIIHTFNDSHQELPSENFLIELFEAQAILYPDDIAVFFKGKYLTYSDLDRLSSQLANFLQKKGVKKHVLIPVFINRSLEMMVVLLGIMKTGAAYVAIPSEFGILKNRIQDILEDTSASLLITDRKNSLAIKNLELDKIIIEDLWADILQENIKFPKQNIEGSDLAYIVYTSGSSGKPKAVLTHHLGLVNFMHAIKLPLQINRKTHFLGLASYSFDGSCLELYLPLLYGGMVTIVPDGVIRDGVKLKKIIAATKASHLHGTPSLFQLLINSGWRNAENALIMSGGEALNAVLRDTIVEFNDCKMWNFYGPTETTLYATHKLLDKSEPITIGKPLTNYQIYIVNEDDNLVPEGVYGELLIGGTGVSKGYLNAIQLTNEKFPNNFFDEEKDNKLYRTGDVGKWNSKGEILLKGRKDNQIILRGYRIELNEIKTILEEYSNIRSFELIFADSENSEEQQIVLFIIPKDSTYDELHLRKFLKLHLPSFMIPSRIFKLEKFPINRNGKIDKNALLKFKEDYTDSSISIKDNSKEKNQLIQIWEEILRIKGIGIMDDFFMLGGNSLLAVRLISSIKKVFNIEFPINQIFEYSTIESLSKQLFVDEFEVKQFLTKINHRGDNIPIFCPAPVGGSPIEYNFLSKALGKEQPFYGFFHKGLNGEEEPFKSVEDAALNFINEIQDYNKRILNFGGYSFGAKIAFEMIYQLEKKGIEVGHFFIFDGFSPDVCDIDHSKVYNMEYIDWVLFFVTLYNNHNALDKSHKIELLREEIEDLKSKDEILKVFHKKLKQQNTEYTFGQLKGHIDVYITNSLINYNAKNKKIKAKITLFKAVESHQSSFSEIIENNFQKSVRDKRGMFDYGWSSFTDNRVNVYEISAAHLNILKSPHAKKIATIMKKYI
ncbi:amino acid adenylation domain-containing protein [Flavobacteriaceae bacterium]|nr:amino acid adenylation domain-containing protein [Flavobacteriaceae bacterium]